MITLNRAKDLLNYHPDTGTFTWKNARGRSRKGMLAGTPNHSDYILIRLDGKHVRAHRLVWLFETGSWPTSILDHIDRVKDNNRFINLREATYQQNTGNTGIQKDNTSGFRGVSRIGKKWTSQIKVSGDSVYLGYFTTPEEASKVYELTAKEWLGEFYSD